MEQKFGPVGVQRVTKGYPKFWKAGKLAQVWDRGWKLLKGDSALMAQILDRSPEFWPEYTRTCSGMVHNTPARNLGWYVIS